MNFISRRKLWCVVLRSLSVILVVSVFGCEPSASDVAIYTSFDWDFERTECSLYPSIKLNGPLFSSSHKFSGFNESVVKYKKIERIEYFGVEVGSGLESVEELGLSVCKFYLAPMKGKQAVIDIHLTTLVKCEIKIANFTEGVLEHVDKETEPIDRPFVFGPGHYHLRAINNQSH